MKHVVYPMLASVLLDAPIQRVLTVAIAANVPKIHPIVFQTHAVSSVGMGAALICFLIVLYFPLVPERSREGNESLRVVT